MEYIIVALLIVFVFIYFIDTIKMVVNAQKLDQDQKNKGENTKQNLR